MLRHGKLSLARRSRDRTDPRPRAYRLHHHPAIAPGRPEHRRSMPYEAEA